MVRSACIADSLDQLEFRVKSTGKIFGLSCVATTWPLLTIILPGLHFACQWPSSSSSWPRSPPPITGLDFTCQWLSSSSSWPPPPGHDEKGHIAPHKHKRQPLIEESDVQLAADDNEGQ